MGADPRVKVWAHVRVGALCFQKQKPKANRKRMCTDCLLHGLFLRTAPAPQHQSSFTGSIARWMTHYLQCSSMRCSSAQCAWLSLSQEFDFPCPETTTAFSAPNRYSYSSGHLGGTHRSRVRRLVTFMTLVTIVHAGLEALSTRGIWVFTRQARLRRHLVADMGHGLEGL